MFDLSIMIFATVVSMFILYALYRDFKIYRDWTEGTIMVVLPVVMAAAWITKYAL